LILMQVGSAGRARACRACTFSHRLAGFQSPSLPCGVLAEPGAAGPAGQPGVLPGCGTSLAHRARPADVPPAGTGLAVAQIPVAAALTADQPGRPAMPVCYLAAGDPGRPGRETTPAAPVPRRSHRSPGSTGSCDAATAGRRRLRQERLLRYIGSPGAGRFRVPPGSGAAPPQPSLTDVTHRCGTKHREQRPPRRHIRCWAAPAPLWPAPAHRYRGAGHETVMTQPAARREAPAGRRGPRPWSTTARRVMLSSRGSRVLRRREGAMLACPARRRMLIARLRGWP
jgi:hypothetical protein